MAAVYIAEGVHRLTRVEVLRVYRWLDTVALFAAFLLLFAYLRQTSPPAYALLGMLYVAAVLPLTYFNAYFHPWDRLSLVCWIGLLLLLRSGRLLSFALLLAFAVSVKYDVILLPGLYFLACVTRDNWREVALRTALLFMVSFGVWLGLRALLPGGTEEGDLAAQIARNWRAFRSTMWVYPPVLGFAIPATLACLGFSSADRFSRASVIFAAILLVPLLTVNFIEIRAQMPVLILILPAALAALRTLCETEPTVVRA